MAVSATTHINVQNGGSDTICGGGFDPSQTAGMWTDGAGATGTSSTCTFTSASKVFGATEVGAYLFIASGTNWKKGWYLITAASGGALTVSAAAGGYQPYGDAVNTADGFASVASPTNATWSIDYSQQAAAAFTGTDGTAAGAGSTLSSATIVFEGHMVGNVVRITAGTNATAGHHVITSVAAGVATFNNAVTTGATADTTIYVGGALATPGYAGAAHIGSNVINVKYHATAYASTSTTSNVTVGRLTMAAGATTAYTLLRGYDVYPGDLTGNRPTIQWGVNAASNYIVTMGNRCAIENIIIDGNRANFTNTGAIGTMGVGYTYNVKIMGCSIAPITLSGGASNNYAMEITNCTVITAVGSSSIVLVGGYFHDNTAGVFSVTSGGITGIGCVFDTNSSAPLLYAGAAFCSIVDRCTFYGNTGPGINVSVTPLSLTISNCIFENNSTFGVTIAGASGGLLLNNNAFYNNTSGNYSTGVLRRDQVIGETSYTSTAFVDAANGDFRLNNAAGRALKVAGLPTTFPGLTWRNYSGVGASGSNPNAGRGGPFQPW